ncbi:hypothetical protein [Kitasatospora sp. SUK 42]|uniref:hypothetical protein n=1 Tax=Kitasatospora sp. SUK 42 TaxID=1588882 RepID=UPI0018CAD23E|nr:hypothetical protein [Kitasatospora sp. SUK 42]MBV2152942.1 hypothetical protein [Kitasatospora sp. SUK 42]
MSASVIARIAKIVPLAIVAAVGVTACGPTDGGSSVAASAPVSVPATTSVATPGAGAVPAIAAPAEPTAAAATPAAATPATGTPAAEAATTEAVAPQAKTTPKAPAKLAPAKPAPAKPATKADAKPVTEGGGIAITFDGLNEGRQIQVGDQVSFSVTWKNNDATGTRSVAPVVATQQYEGAPCQQALAMAQGTLERKDASGWKAMPSLSQGGGMDYAGTGDDAAFTLAAGESRTVEYRMLLDAGNQPGRLAVEADAVLPASLKVMTKSVVTTSVVDQHRPVVNSVSDPTALVVGKAPTEFSFKVSSPDGPALLRPVVRLSLPSGAGLTGSDVTMEAKVGNEWKSFEVTADCNGRLGVAPAQLVGVMQGDPVEYTFRVGLKRTGGAGPVEIQVGGDSDGHSGATVALRPTVQR